MRNFETKPTKTTAKPKYSFCFHDYSSVFVFDTKEIFLRDMKKTTDFELTVVTVLKKRKSRFVKGKMLRGLDY